jgi:homocysteine S-methyltransferase
MRGREKEAGAAEGLEVAREMIAAVSGKVGGFYIIAPFGRYGLAADLVREVRSRQSV